MVERTVRLIDAFVGPGCKGNRAAVLQLDKPLSTDEMQSLAAQMGQPATAFVTMSDLDDVHEVRWFATDHEIALCGHGSLAAGHALLTASGAESARLRAKDGRILEIRRMEGEARYALAIPTIVTEPREWPELAVALGEPPVAIRWNPAGYVIALFEDPELIARLSPDPGMLSALGNIQVTATAPGSVAGRHADITSRVFYGGGREDAATGSAHAALTPFWCERLGVERIVAHQASAAGGWFECSLSDGMVRLGGQCADAA